MKQVFEVYRGCEIPVLGGYLEVISTNGNVAYCDEYQINENGTEFFVDERYLTGSDIARILREYDGRICSIVFLDEYYGEEVSINEKTRCWLDLEPLKFYLKTLDGDVVLSATYEEAGINTEAEGDYSQYSDYFEDAMGFIPEYRIG